MMQSTESPSSANFEGQEHRSSPRLSYPYWQKIAPMIDGAMPSAEEFFSVRCKDLSGGGVSILLDAPPEFDHLAVALGTAPELSYVSAQVMFVQELELDGKPQYLAGCRFIERLQSEASNCE